MPSVSIFQTLRDKVTKSNGLLPAEKRAMFWFSSYSAALKAWQSKNRGIVTFTKLQTEPITKELLAATNVWPGCLYFFAYDPKGNATLPYYDEFPFVLCIKRTSGSFLGLNFHYLDYRNRAILFDALYHLHSDENMNLRTRLLVTYDLLQASSKYKQFRPCIKRYLNTHIQGPLLKVGASEWDIALFLPVESFAKQPMQNVWGESRQKF